MGTDIQEEKIHRRGREALETIQGYIEHIVYRNEENGYTVFSLTNDDGEVT